MKLAFLLLVLLNLVLYAWQQGVFGRYGEPGREPERVARQIEPERFRVLTEGDVKALRERASQGAVSLIPGAAQACVELGDFPTADAARAEKALAALSPPPAIEVRSIEVPGWTMVYLPPYPTQADAERRADELRRLGIRDLFVTGDNAPMKFAISLGSFRDPAAARAHLATLERMGVKGARVSDRPAGVPLTRFQLRAVDAAAARQLRELQQQFPAQTLRACTPG
jgi:hypothetical protein